MQNNKNLTMIDVARGVFWGNILTAAVPTVIWMVIINR